jgi:hypothetical protein
VAKPTPSPYAKGADEQQHIESAQEQPPAIGGAVERSR